MPTRGEALFQAIRPAGLGCRGTEPRAKSPTRARSSDTRGKTLIFGTTNGTPAVLKAAGSEKVLLCGFVNLPSLFEILYENGDPFPLAILCAGKMNRFSIEDAACAGLLVEKVKNRSQEEVTLNDAARVSTLLAKEFGNDILSLLYSSDHGKYLISLGMEADLAVCASNGVLPVVPVLKDGKLVKWEAD